jgi:hypothetical protein
MMALHAALAVLTAVMAAVSAVMKVRRNPHVVATIHQVVGVPLKWLDLLALCELAGSAGLIAGLAWRPVGIAAAAGLTVYFVGAAVAHLRVGDVKGIGPAAFMLSLSAASLATRILA